MIDPSTFATLLEPLNEQQREAVYCDRNCVVTAGAGSGKTTVLSYRFLRLIVEQKAHVDEILTLTFSRMAAAEMNARIHGKLHEFSRDEDIHAELVHFSEATITTIDAFCNRIVAADPTRYGIGPDFTMDEQSNREMAAQCAYDLLVELGGHPGVSFLATVYHPDELVDSLFVELASTRFHPSSTFDATSCARSVRLRIEQVYQSTIAEVMRAYSVIAGIDGEGKQFEYNRESARSLLSQASILQTAGDPSVCLEILESVVTKRCSSKKDFAQRCNEQVEILRDVLPLARKACAALKDQHVLGPIYEVLSLYHARYLATKRERGILTFGDIAHMARDILIHNPTVRRHFQRKFRYIMVDEFQDTNRLQKDLVYLLAQDPLKEVSGIPKATNLLGDKLFFVGDEKQSIYRFRGADVSVFKQLDLEIAQSGGLQLTLHRNYRSEPQLIGFFNTMFERIMGDASMLYEAQFKPLTAREVSHGVSPRITFLWKGKASADEAETDKNPSEDSVDAVQAEAYALASLIEQMTQTDGYLLPDGDSGTRRPSFEDIAILFRTSSNQLHYEKALRIAGIPYTLSAVQSLFLEAPANDIYLFLQLLIYPKDTLAFAGLLRSPFCRLSDDALLSVLDAMDTDKTAFPLVQLDSGEQSRYESCRSLYLQLQELASSGASVAALVSFLWHDGGYRYYLLSDRLYQVYLEHFEFLLELAIRFDTRDQGLPAFLDFLRPRLGQKEKLSEVEPLRDSMEGVRLMTVHKSKGLEFPIVILANMGTASRNATTPAWHVLHQASDTLVVPSHMHRYDKTTNLLYEMDKPTLQAMETAEMKRLFYVALTRAKTHLVLSGCENSQNMGEKATDRNFLALFLHHSHALEQGSALGKSFGIAEIGDAPISVLQASVSPKKVAGTILHMKQAYIDPIPKRTFAPTSFAVTRLTHADEAVVGRADIDQDLVLPALPADAVILEHALSAQFGTWCHALLQRSLQAYMQGNRVVLPSIDDAFACMPAEFLQAGLHSDASRLVAESVVSLAHGFLSSTFFASLVEANPIAMESEVGFSLRMKVGTNDRAVVNGSIDLLVRYADAVCVIDFKTDAFRMPYQHGEQLAMYRQGAARLYGLPVRSALCYLRQIGSEVWITG